MAMKTIIGIKPIKAMIVGPFRKIAARPINEK